MNDMVDELPLPERAAPNGLSHLLLRRRSTKRFAPDPISLADAGSVLWAAGGSTEDGHRVSPSARRTYPVRLTLVAGNVAGLESGCYHYEPHLHTLTPGARGDQRTRIASATLDAPWLSYCPALVLLTADLATARTGFDDQPPEHGEHFAWLEAGHAAQNVYLWAAERRLGAVLVAGLDDRGVDETCRPLLPGQHQLLGLLGIGVPAGHDSQPPHA